MKFLIVKLSSLGDIVHALPIVNVLRENFSDSQIDWLVAKEGYELLSLIKEINHVYKFNLDNISCIQKEKYDYIIDAQGLFKSAFISKILSGKTIIGFKKTREFADLFYDIKVDVGNLFKTSKHIVNLNIELIAALIRKIPNSIKFLIPKITTSEGVGFKILSSKRRRVVIFPATTWESKMWPLNYWFDIISELSGQFTVFVCASNSDRIKIEPLISQLNLRNIEYENLTGKTSINDLIYLIQNSNLVIGLDSFGLHIASAINNDYGSPEVIGIFGPTNLHRNGPYGLLKNCFYLSKLECIACRKKRCPLGHHKCMNNIIPSYVKDMIYSKLKNNRLSIC